MIILGIDPGINGAVALYDTGSNTIVTTGYPHKTEPYKKTTRKIIDGITLHRYLSAFAIDEVWMEKVNAFGMGRTSAFRFGEANGVAIGVISALGLSINFVTPQKWKYHFALDNDKARSRELAQQFWPDAADQFARVKDTDRSEAALIAMYGALTNGYTTKT